MGCIVVYVLVAGDWRREDGNVVREGAGTMNDGGDIYTGDWNQDAMHGTGNTSTT